MDHHSFLSHEVLRRDGQDPRIDQPFLSIPVVTRPLDGDRLMQHYDPVPKELHFPYFVPKLVLQLNY
jgi:hypothetical protein